MNTNRKESLWIHCPICRGKTRTKVYEDKEVHAMKKL
ncbi:MAG: cysteine-rich KTR domain-containing protein [Clostridia bacterium]|nr:cysteine-rich KTR domain-containing protein [Clostridia bacterium]